MQTRLRLRPIWPPLQYVLRKIRLVVQARPAANTGDTIASVRILSKPDSVFRRM